jgi:transcriptional regulator with XRE-family HTH domain
VKELELTVRVRNNRLKQRRDELGLSQKQMADVVGIHHQQYGGLECMRLSPIKDGEWTEPAVKLAEYHGVSIDELFPGAVLEVAQTTAVRKLDGGDVAALLAATSGGRYLLPAPGDAVDHGQLKQILSGAVGALDKRTRDMVVRRFGLDGGSEQTFDQIGEVHGLSVERVRQIIYRALKQIRWAHRELRDFMGGT